MRAGASGEPWNHNSHYHEWLLRHLPRRFGRGLDIGCGLGFFAARLAERADRVDALDADADALAAAAALHASSGVAFQRGPFLETSLPSDAYDVVTCIAALHHMDLEPALVEMKRVLGPGGQLAVLGLYRETAWADYAVSLVALPANLLRTHLVARSRATLQAPTRDATRSLAEIRRSVDLVLPGARVQRHLYWRYSLLWRKPGATRPPPPERGREA